MYTQLNATCRPESVTSATQTTVKVRKRHHRTNSGSMSSKSPGRSRTSSNRTTVVDTETQTDYMDISETDISPGIQCASKTFLDREIYQPQRVILHEIRSGSDSDGCSKNGNCVKLHYIVPHAEPGKIYFFFK